MEIQSKRYNIVLFQNLYTYFHSEKVCWAHSSAWLERPAHNRSAGGSNPLGPIMHSDSNISFEKKKIVLEDDYNAN